MMSLSILSREAAFEYGATPMVSLKLILTRVPKMENDPLVRKPDITKAEIMLGFSPKIGLEEGMQKTFDHFAKQIK